MLFRKDWILRADMLQVFNKSQVPSFISAEAAETVFETGRSLRYLERFHPRHPLSVPATVKSDDAPRLHWKFSWQDLEEYDLYITLNIDRANNQ